MHVIALAPDAAVGSAFYGLVCWTCIRCMHAMMGVGTEHVLLTGASLLHAVCWDMPA